MKNKRRQEHQTGRCNKRPLLRSTLQATLLAIISLSAAAQESADAKKLERVEITGSAIKRIDSEGSLPVQVITRADMVKAGITTAAELVATLSAGSNALTDGVSMAFGGYKDQQGLNSANLRGLGTSSTLVLLNGRRMANFASPGDDSGVDLNSIPAAAIQRVEVLLDGASAIYGADAIGGVVNFITRKDYQGFEAEVYAGTSQEGGAGKRAVSLSGGFGDIARDRFNIFGVLDVQHTDALSTSQRKFINDLKIPERAAASAVLIRLPRQYPSQQRPARLPGKPKLPDQRHAHQQPHHQPERTQMPAATHALPAGWRGRHGWLHLRLHARCGALPPRPTRPISLAAPCCNWATNTSSLPRFR